MHFGNMGEVGTYRKEFVCPEYVDLIQYMLMFFNEYLLSTIMCKNKNKHTLFNLYTFTKFNEILSPTFGLVPAVGRSWAGALAFHGDLMV